MRWPIPLSVFSYSRTAYRARMVRIYGVLFEIIVNHRRSDAVERGIGSLKNIRRRRSLRTPCLPVNQPVFRDAQDSVIDSYSIGLKSTGWSTREGEKKNSFLRKRILRYYARVPLVSLRFWSREGGGIETLLELFANKGCRYVESCCFIEI